MAQESKYAEALRQRGFAVSEEMTAQCHGRKGPTFLASPPGSEPVTIANDELGLVWICYGETVDLTSLGFINLWHPVLTPLGRGFIPAPDFPEKEKLELPAYFNWDFGGTRITMAIDIDGRCWQAAGEIDLSEHGFIEHDAGTWKKITRH
jgi:hypothetical protein